MGFIKRRAFANGKPYTEAVARIVADHYGVKRAELYRQNRQRGVARARMILMFLLRETTAMSLLEIGDLIGKDHSTVVHGIRSVRLARESDPFLRHDLVMLGERILEEMPKLVTAT